MAIPRHEGDLKQNIEAYLSVLSDCKIKVLKRSENIHGSGVVTEYNQWSENGVNGEIKEKARIIYSNGSVYEGEV